MTKVLGRSRAATHCLLVVVHCAVGHVMSDSARAQGVDGHVSVMVDAVPSASVRTVETRSRVFVERRFELGERVRVTTSGFVEGLLGRRQGVTVGAAIAEPLELHGEFRWSKADVRVGMGRVVWGRLDEFQPTDVVNPLVLSRFFLEGRSEARLAVPLVRGRLLPSDRVSIEGVYVPVFCRARFDRLDEASSPFSIAPAIPAVPAVPARTWRNLQGGARFGVTTGRVDWAVSAFRGFEPFAIYSLDRPFGRDGQGRRSGTEVAVGTEVAGGTEVGDGGSLTAQFPRFTMLGGDFETTKGTWGIRGEAAAFVQRTLQVATQPSTVAGRTFEAGIGVDRRAGAYRVAGNVLVAARRANMSQDEVDTTEMTVVTSVDRSFTRETRQLRVLGVYNPQRDSGFLRVVGTIHWRDNVHLEASGGAFVGSDDDVISRFARRDFLFLRLKVFY